MWLEFLEMNVQEKNGSEADGVPIYFFFPYKLENYFICSRALARVPLGLLKLLLSVRSLSDLEHIELNSLAQGGACTVPETGRRIHRHVLAHRHVFSKQLYFRM